MEDRLTRQKWLDAGLATLAAEGPAGLRIMPIALQLKVTKGSFYWHFENLEAYHEALLAEWEFRHTDQIVTEVEKSAGDARMRLRQLTTLTLRSDPRLTQAMRAWALTLDAAQSAIERVDRKRLSYLAMLIGGLGWSEADARVLAHWGYSALIGHFHLGGPVLSFHEIDLILGTLLPFAKSKN